jgi:hypothetical protein
MPTKDYWWSMLNCVFGATILRTSACTINDIFDRKVDAGVGKFCMSFLFSVVRSGNHKLVLKKDQSRVVGFLFSLQVYMWRLNTASDLRSLRQP